MTFIAFYRSLTSINSHVDFHIRTCTKTFPTLSAFQCFSPVCTRWCVSSSFCHLKALPQKLLINFDTPVCEIMCLSRLFFLGYLLPHTVHWWFFCPVWLGICSFNLDGAVKPVQKLIFCHQMSNQIETEAVDPPKLIEKVSKDLEKKEVIEEESKIEYIIIRNISSRVA